MSRVEDRRSRITGLIVGTVAAHRILRERREDSEILGGTYLPTGEIGIHDVDPNNPGQSFIGPDVGLLPPFAVPDITLYRAPPPPAIDSLEYAMADGGISAWDSKYAYDYWRPVIGIRRADEDGNDWTEADPFWSPLGGSRSNPFVPGESNFTPPFPAYTSAHATFGAAALKIVANFYQSDEVPFTFISDEWNGTTVDQFGRRRPLIVRHYSSLSQAVAENAASRVFNGVYWRYDGTEGVRAGNAIADYVFDHLLRPRRGGTHSIPDASFEQQIDDILAAAQF